MSDLTPGRPDLAVAAALGVQIPQRCRVSVDLSRMDNSGRRSVEFDDCDFVPAIGDLLDACDLAGRREATAEVVGINQDARTISIAIDWRTVREVAG